MIGDMAAKLLAALTVLALLGSVSSCPPKPRTDGAGYRLKVGYYKGKCGRDVDVEAVVRKAVSKADAGVKAGLIRLFFHDCFVRGCDASVLLEPTSGSPQPEKLGVPNFPSLRGFEVIDAAKAELEARCPGVVSCADVVAFAARDASSFLSSGRARFAMPAGRYDGNVSLASETLTDLPPPFAGVARLRALFAAKGLDAHDMVTLSGAHSVGRSHCSSFSDRLLHIAKNSSSSDMEPEFAASLEKKCGVTSSNNNGSSDNTVVQDYKTPNKLDNQYYKNVLDHKVLFASDAALLDSWDTEGLVKLFADAYIRFPGLWEKEFGEAMVKMGRIEVKTAANGEIRRTCGFINANTY
ncbi:hypothetical protein QOZ80_4BG0349120 [Eleusine coracana subsp. coracana]|nr:hypothetical protein QOZ80_4BG0349120 [Eleusine coracana subsp. coracana]